jgi:cation:H+ antiporter
MILPIVAVVIGLLVLIWSADKFVEGASGTAYLLGVPPLLVGMVIVGFGTSAPEIVVSVFAAIQGNPSLSLGNAMGSNISNIALILGITALVSPIIVHSSIVRKELPILGGASLVMVALLLDRELSRWDGAILLVLFTLIMAWSIWTALHKRTDQLNDEFDESLNRPDLSMGKSVFALILGLVFLIGSSRALVWGAVEIAYALNVSELIVGLTVVAVGTSLPELASSIAATRKGEHDIALGNVVGSNLFNTLMVVGMASTIRPLEVEAGVLYRDAPVMGVLTLFLFMTCLARKGKGKVNRWEGALLVAAYLAYTVWLVMSALSAIQSQS